MLALLTLVKPPAASTEGRSGSRRWSSVQQEELQLQALASLAMVAPLMLDDYMANHGNSYLLQLLDWCTDQGEEGKINMRLTGDRMASFKKKKQLDGFSNQWTPVFFFLP